MRLSLFYHILSLSDLLYSYLNLPNRQESELTTHFHSCTTKKIHYGLHSHRFLELQVLRTLDNIIIQTYRQRSAPYTNLYTRTKRCYWLESKIFSQPQFRNLSTPIKQPIVCIQIQRGSLVLILVYIFNCLMYLLILEENKYSRLCPFQMHHVYHNVCFHFHCFSCNTFSIVF